MALFGPGTGAEHAPLTVGPTYPIWDYTEPVPVLTVTPEQRDVSAAAGTTTFTVTNTGTGGSGELVWTASRQSQDLWITGLSITQGGGGVTVTYDANPTTSPRTASIIFTADGAVGSPFAALVVQAGAPAP